MTAHSADRGSEVDRHDLPKVDLQERLPRDWRLSALAPSERASPLRDQSGHASVTPEARPSLIDRVRSVFPRWRVAAAGVGYLVLCEIGARIGLPGVDGRRVADFFHSANQGLLPAYDLLTGGGTSRAAILALGAIPYLQARLYLWLARSLSQRVRRATARPATRSSAVRVTTAVVALVQSFGLARFLQTVSGAVAEPGAGFVVQTVVLVTGGAVVVGWLAEIIVRSWQGDVSADDDTDPIEMAPEAPPAA